MKFAIRFSLALVVACNGTSSIGEGTPDAGDVRPDSGPPSSDASGAPGRVGSASNPAGGSPATGTTGPGGGSGGSNPNDASGGSANGSRGAPTCAATIHASASNDYELVTTFGFELTHVAPNVDLTFDWSRVTRDFFGNSLDPQADIAHLELALLGFKLEPEQFAEQFMALSTQTVGFLGLDTMGSLTRAGTEDLDVQVKLVPELDGILPDFDQEPFGKCTYLLSLASTSATGSQIRMFAPFILDIASKNTSIVMTPQSTTLAYAANLTALTPVNVPPHNPHALLDLTELTADVFGRPFPPTLREIRISEHSRSLDELAADVMDLDAVADHVWRAPLDTEKTIDLSTLTDDDGQAFPGVEPDGHTWLLALDAGDVIPAPAFLTALEPCSAP